MAKVKFDVTGTEFGQAKEYAAQPKKGVYPCKIVEINPGFSKGEDGKPDKTRPRLEVIYEVMDKEAKSPEGESAFGARIWDYVSPKSEAAEWRYAQWLEALGLAGEKKKDRKGEFDTDDLIGMTVKIRVKADTNLEGDYKAKVGGIYALPEDEEPDDDDEDDENDDEENDDDDADDDDDDDSDDDDDDEEEEVDYSEMSVKELRDLAVERELVKKKKAADLKKKALIELLEADDEEDEDDDDDSDDDDDDSDDDDDDDDDEDGDDDEEELPFEEWSIKELRAECEKRKLNSKGKKAALVKRLKEDDDSDDDDGDDKKPPF